MSDEEDKDTIMDALIATEKSNRPPEEKQLAYEALVSVTRWRTVASTIQGLLLASAIVGVSYFGECSC